MLDVDQALRDALIEAWKRHDERALSFGQSKSKATSETLKPETNKLVDISAEYAEAVGFSITQLSDLRQTWRRAGLGYEATLKVIEFGATLRD